jgi:hypothetical protein
VRGKHFASIHAHRQQRLPAPRPAARDIELSAPWTAGGEGPRWPGGGRPGSARPGQVSRPGAPVAAAVVGRPAGLQPRLAPVGHPSGPAWPTSCPPPGPGPALGLTLWRKASAFPCASFPAGLYSCLSTCFSLISALPLHQITSHRNRIVRPT